MRQGPRQWWSLRFLTALVGLAIITVGWPSPPAQAEPAPIVLQQTLVDITTQVAGSFGTKVATDGDWLAVARDAPSTGVAIIGFHREETRWIRKHTFTVTWPLELEDLDLDGTTVAVAVKRYGLGLPGSSSETAEVRIFDFAAAAAAPAVIPDPTSQDSGFGRTIDLDGDQLIIGLENALGTDDIPPAAALVYRQSAGSWTAERPERLAVPGSLFGLGAVTIAGTTAVVDKEGSPLIYRHGATGWTLLDPDLTGFGTYVGLVGNELISQVPPPDPTDPAEFGVWAVDDAGISRASTLSVPAAAGWSAVVGTAALALVDDRGTVIRFDRTPDGWEQTGAGPGLLVDRSVFTMAVGDEIVSTRSDPEQRLYGDSVSLYRTGGSAATAPGPVRGLAAVPYRSANRARISWTRPADVGSGITGSVVRAVPVGDGEIVQTGVATGAQTVHLRGLELGRQYTFQVAAVGRGGVGPYRDSGAVRISRPTPVASPFTVLDKVGDVADGRIDAAELTTEITGRAVTFRLTTRDPTSPYVGGAFTELSGDPSLPLGNFIRFPIFVRTGVGDRGFTFKVPDDPEVSPVPGERFVFQRRITTTCRTSAARYVDHSYVATVPLRCLDEATRLRVRAILKPYDDRVPESPPVARATERGHVSLGAVLVPPVQVWARSDRVYDVTVKAFHPSGIRSAVIRGFSVGSETRPARTGRSTCRAASTTTSYCTTRFRVRPGELRDQDAGTWRVFAQVRARNGDVAVRERAGSFLVRRGTVLRTSTTVGSTIEVSGTLSAAQWNRRRYVGVGGASVSLQSARPGSGRYTTVSTTTTATDDGTFTLRGSYRSDRRWRVAYAGGYRYAPVAEEVRR